MEDYNMKANKINNNVEIFFSEEEALVLLEWLHNFNEKEHLTLFEDKSEQIILWYMEAELEKVVSATFDNNYKNILSEARQKIIDIE